MWCWSGSCWWWRVTGEEQGHHYPDQKLCKDKGFVFFFSISTMLGGKDSINSQWREEREGSRDILLLHFIKDISSNLSMSSFQRSLPLLCVHILFLLPSASEEDVLVYPFKAHPSPCALDFRLSWVLQNIAPLAIFLLPWCSLYLSNASFWSAYNHTQTFPMLMCTQIHPALYLLDYVLPVTAIYELSVLLHLLSLLPYLVFIR